MIRSRKSWKRLKKIKKNFFKPGTDYGHSSESAPPARRPSEPGTRRPGVRGPEAETRRIRGQRLGVEMLGDLTHSASRPGPAPRTLVILPTLISTQCISVIRFVIIWLIFDWWSCHEDLRTLLDRRQAMMNFKWMVSAEYLHFKPSNGSLCDVQSASQHRQDCCEYSGGQWMKWQNIFNSSIINKPGGSWWEDLQELSDAVITCYLHPSHYLHRPILSVSCRLLHYQQHL